MSSAGESIAIIGAGSIGVAFAIRFASTGHRVWLYDVDQHSLDRACHELGQRLQLLEQAGLVSAPSEIADLVAYTSTLAVALDGAVLVQECAPERVEIKQTIFNQIDALNSTAVLTSASSAITASTIGAGLAESIQARLLIAHPANPPYLLPVIELAPSPATAASAVARAKELYAAAGLVPVMVHGEPEGFVFNRLQGAVLREAYCLVRDGVASVDDIDQVMRHGLGRRWSVIGPFETVDLNTRGGITSHAEKMGPAYARMGAERGQDDPWTEELVANVDSQRRALVPLGEWADRVAWRDEQLIRLTPIWDQIATSEGR